MREVAVVREIQRPLFQISRRIELQKGKGVFQKVKKHACGRTELYSSLSSHVI